MSWIEWAAAEAEAIAAAGRWRSIRALDGGGPSFTLDGSPVVSFASNDYLGLSQHRAVIAAAHDALDRGGAGSGSARLVVGARPVHAELEAELASWKGQARALLFPTGFAANLGVLSVFGGADVTVCSDELNHASIIDGCRLSRARVEIFGHRDLDHLAKLLADAERAIVVSDTAFSMDGDVADVDALAELCTAHGALLVLDEAHAVLGPALSSDHPDVLRVGTLSKTLGSLGGFVAGPAPLIELLLNRARPFIFTTATTPADTAAALAALRVLRSDEGEALVARLRMLVDRVHPGHPSPIVPIILGDEARALAASDALLALGLLVPAIRPPTVPEGTSRLRVTLSAAHTDADVDRLLVALGELGA
ncbi:MAG: glycine C-acetyltransferase [Actinomycetota bacterium]|nr:glycine C-acetyltransferase [Actinomycetota bacterium]